MSEGLAATFQVLTQTPNEAAVRALTAVLDSPLENVRRQALEALITRRSNGGKREVLARIDQLDGDGLDFFCQKAARMTGTLRSAILDPDDPLRGSACQAALLLGEVDLIPALVSALENPHEQGVDEVAATMIELTRRLADQLHETDAPPGHRDPATVRDNVIGALERAIREFTRHDRLELVEAFVLLVSATNTTLTRTLNSSGNPAASRIGDLLIECRHQGVISLVLDMIEGPKAPVAAVAAVARRTDLAFVRGLLHRVGEEPSSDVRKALKRVRALPWLADDGLLLGQLDDTEQHLAVSVAMRTAVARSELFALVRRILAGGGTQSRRTAAAALEGFNGAESNELALATLDDADPLVQASVLRNLRRRGIPGILPRLIEMTESSHDVVRLAARDNLDEFSFQRFVGAFDMLDDEVRQSTGEMVKKVDPFTLPMLRELLTNDSRGKRLRGIEIAVCLDLIDEVPEEMGELLRDEDLIVRLETVAALTQTTSAGGESLLNRALDDPNERVRQAARRSLHDRQVVGQWQQVWDSPDIEGQDWK